MFNWISQNGLTFLAFGGYIVAGVLVVLGYLGMGSRDRRKDDDTVATNLINNLQKTVDLQEKTIKATSDKLDQTTKELHQMQGRNSVLEGLFNGNENSILSFLKAAPRLISVAEENNTLAKATNASVGQMAQALTSLMQHLDTTKSVPQLDVTELKP